MVGELLPERQVLQSHREVGCECGAHPAKKRPHHTGMLTPACEKDQVRHARTNKWNEQGESSHVPMNTTDAVTTIPVR